MTSPSPSAPSADRTRGRNKGRTAVRVLTVGGEVELRRRYFWSQGQGGGHPADAWVGIAGDRVSPGARELCCTLGVVQDFAQGAEDLQRTAGLRVSKERLRQITESEAAHVERAYAQSALAPMWRAGETQAVPGGPSRVYIGADGVMVRTVTQEEKDARRREQATRRQQRGRAGLGNARPLPPPKPGSDDGFKEMKIGLFYDQGKTRVQAFATEGNHQVFGRRLRQHADAIGLKEAAEILSLTDGGPWIRNQILEQLPEVKAMLLDFYHLSEHVWSAARTCWGEGEDARHWVERQLHDLKTVGPRALLAAIDALQKSVRSKAKREALRRLRQYVRERWEMVDYPAALARGWDIGSGPTEAMCKNLTLRLKRPGMKWDADHAAGLMNLIALRESKTWAKYWETRKCA